MSYYDQIKDLVDVDDTFYIDGNVSEEIIKDCENNLGIILPKEYKKYIIECGYIGFGDSILLGLDSDGENEERGTVLGDTQFAREEFNLEKEFVVIQYQDYENLYALKCSSSEELNDSPIFSFDINHDNKLAKPTKVSDTFEEHYEYFVTSLKD